MREKTGFRVRTFVSLLLTGSTVALAVSGVAVFIKPEGSVARKLGWTLLGLSKGQWESVHTVLGFFILIVAAVHVWLNGTALVRYLGSVVSKGMTAKREALLAVAVLVLLVVLTLFQVPPISTFVDLGDRAKAHWESQVPSE